MTLPTWPSTLPYRPSASGFSRGDFVTPNIAMETEDGPPIQRVQSQTLIERIAWSQTFSGDQLTTFRTFWSSLGRGTAHFKMLVPSESGSYSTRRSYIDRGAYKIGGLGGNWYSLSFVLCAFSTDYYPSWLPSVGLDDRPVLFADFTAGNYWLET